jgi:hypothetical protein
MQWPHGGDVGQGPYSVKLKTAISSAAAGSLTTIDVESAWNTAWGTPPAGFQPGEPLSAFEDHFLMPVEPGDILELATGEYVKLVQKISSSRWVVSRGLGRDQSWLYPRAATAGTTIYTYCSGGFQNDMPELRYIWWNFLQSPDASSNYKVMFGSHPVARGNTRVDEGYSAVTGNIFTDTSLWSVKSQTVFISPSPAFSSAKSVADGNSYQKHPSMPMSSPGWFLDHLPLIGTSAFGTSAQPAVRVDGNAYRYFYNGLDADGLSRKQLPTIGVCGPNLLRDVSGPGSKIAGDASGAYTYCVANAAGECAPGSRQGDIYFSCPTVTKPYCGSGEMYTGADDVCIGDKPNIGLSVAQYKLASDQTGQSIRVLSRFRAQRLWPSTANTKPLPDGSWTMVFNPEGKYLMKIPPIPVSDGVDRTRFIPARLNLVPPAGVAVASAVVLFGYTENGAADQYFCTTRQESCVVTGAAIADNNPFYYQSTDTYNPTPCSNGCSISVPVIPGRVAYFEVQYMDAAGQMVAAERGVAAESSVSKLASISFSAPI